MRIFALSDLHVDHRANRQWLEQLSASRFRDSALIVAGDLSDNLELTLEALRRLRDRFALVSYVPGNHELWVRDEEYADSRAKFHALLDACEEAGISTRPCRAGGRWIVPLFSWYDRPQDSEHSLFIPREGDDPQLQIWSDTHFFRWPQGERRPAEYFARQNGAAVSRSYDGPVLSFSHFLPRRELMFEDGKIPSDAVLAERARKWRDHPLAAFNFSRVSGNSIIEAQLRQIGSQIHIYGHQHRNRDIELDGVRYVSHCLGYARERRNGVLVGVGDEPKLVLAAQS